MRNAEEAIGRVLAGLRDAEAPPGMELRILAAVEARASRRHVAKPFWIWSVVFASMVAVVLLMAIAVIHRHGQTTNQAQTHAIPTETSGGTQRALLQPQKPDAPAKAPIRIATPVRKAPPINTEEAMLLRDMRASSHPAPVAPLTNEEKLLLRAVHLGDPQVTAMLDPEVRARQEAENAAEFQKFVEQSDKEDQEANQPTE